MKILIAFGSKGKFFHLKEFGNALERLGVEIKLVKDTDYCRGFPSKNIKDWFMGSKKFKNLIKDFKPEVIFVDRQTLFGVESIKSGIPTYVLLRGHFWQEQEWARKTLYRDPIMKYILKSRNKISEKCLKNCSAVLPICKYLEDVVKNHYSKQKTHIFLEGIDESKWYNENGIKLKHPCVGLVQDANWWGKTKEMLILKNVLEKMPEVNFYWVGDGPYRIQINNELKKFKNFKWIGRLEYPDGVRQFLTEIDIYALITGMDLAPLTLKEAQLMKKPVIATNVGGVNEMMQDGNTGFLVNEGNSEEIIKNIKFLLSNEKKKCELGENGRKFVQESFNWDLIAEKFLDFIQKKK